MQSSERKWFSAGGLGGLLFTGAIVMNAASLQTMNINVPSMRDYAQASTISTAVSSAPVEGIETHALPGSESAMEEPLEEINVEMAMDPRFPMNGESIITVEVGRGDTLIDLLTSHEISRENAHSVVESMRHVYSPRRIRAGQEITMELKHTDGVTELQSMEFASGKLETVAVKSGKKGFEAARTEIPTTRQLARAGGTINSSFYETGSDAGLPAKLIVELMKAYSYDVDFARDIKPGQKLDVLFEQVKDDQGNTVATGEMKYASLDLGSKTLEIYRHVDKDGFVGYYTPTGESIRKALLRTPINGARMSSNFGMRRHPILGYSKMHTGVDFAAPRGTPVYAAGDGIISMAGRRGGYGNYLQIKHNGTYASAYAHLHRFANGIRNGSRVRQGQVVAYVGSTGRSTGPHLHYEILKYGRHVNPKGVQFRTGQTLTGRELANFKKEVNHLQNQFASLPRIRTQVASAE